MRVWLKLPKPINDNYGNAICWISMNCCSSARENADLEEERRLFYVGLTRAKERVWLLNCRSRFLFGERRDREPSRFLQEFDDNLKETTIMPDRPRRSKPEPEQLSLLG